MQFDKVLRAFETGGFTYVDVRSQLTLILAKGASPSELLETLRRRERVEPLPPQAHEEVLRLLNDAAEQQAEASPETAHSSVGENQETMLDRGEANLAGAMPNHFAVVRELQERLAQQSTEFEALARNYERTKDGQSSASERVTALAAELAAATRALESEQNKALEIGKALTERTASAEAHQSRGEELQRKAKEYDVELRAARESLGESESNLTALRHELAARTRELLERKQNTPQVLADMQAARADAAALSADLADARALLETAQLDLQAAQQRHAEGSAAAESLHLQLHSMRRTAEQRAAEADTLRATLVDRDEQLTALEQDQASTVLGQESHAKTLMQAHADLSAARARADALLLDLNSSRGTTASLDAQLKRAKFDLEAARNELASVKAQAHSYFDLLRTREWRRASDDSDASHSVEGISGGNVQQLQAQLSAMQAQMGAHNSEIEQLRAVRNELVEPAALEPVDLDIDPPPVPIAPKFVSRPERVSRNRVAVPRAYAVGAVVLALAVIVWFLVHSGTHPGAVVGAVRPSVASGSVINDCPTCPSMVVLPTGRFKQGANEGENTSPFDKPRHWVGIAHAVAMSMNTVTRDEFAAFVAATGRDMPGCDVYDGAWKHDPAASWKNPGFAQSGAHPVTCVSWNDAQAYASWVSSKAGRKYRLPSASEWEYAARAGSETTFPWGVVVADTCANANVADQSAAQQYPGWSVFGCSDGWVNTSPVGTFKANAFALNDMLGNVFQWTQDCWKADYTGAPVDGSARADGNCAQRELRGGSWFSNPNYVRSNYRNHFATDYRTSSVGIRLVRELE